MKIRLVNCNLLITFFSNIALAGIATWLFASKPESMIWYRLSWELAVNHINRPTIKFPQEFSLTQNKIFI